LEIKNKNDLLKIIEQIFSISNDGLAVIDKEENLIKYNNNFSDFFLPVLNVENDNITDYIKNFSITDNEEQIYELENNIKIEVKIKHLGTDFNNYYIVCIKDYNKDELLRKMYETVIRTLSDGIQIIDTKGKIRICNDAQGNLDGFFPKEVIGKHIKNVYKVNDETSLLLKALITKKPINNERQIYYTKNGYKIDAVTSAFPLYYNSKLIGSASVVRDFSKVQKLIERNIEIEKQLISNLNNDTQNQLYFNFSDIITQNKEMQDLISFAKLASTNDSNVLIYGETGTGKELFSQSIHTASKRKNKPFMALNCAAIPETLLESLLFGTTKGAFTGSVDKAGLFEQTDGGTIFLDEINSMSYMLQSKLLRILETKQVMRLGDNKSIPIDVRLISSFNQNPMELVEKGTFRSDLFFRLAVVFLSIPPLRNRMDDLNLLLLNFIIKFNNKLNKNVVDISSEVRNLFLKINWSGNVRQLSNVIESSMTMINDTTKFIELKHIPKHLLEFENNKLNGNNVNSNKVTNNVNINNEFENDSINLFEKLRLDEYNQIIKCLNETNGNIAKAANIMGTSRQKLHYRIKKYNIK